MRILEGLSSEPAQSLQHILDTGDRITIKLKYRPAIQMWYMDIISDQITLYGYRIVNSFNMLHQYMNTIDFGIAIFIDDWTEPLLINDFATQRVRIGILNAAEVEAYEQALRDSNG